MSKIKEIFGSMVFNDEVMKQRLPKPIYATIQKAVQMGAPLEESEVADVVAEKMRDWAIENGATHFTHWSQPLTGITAEKHHSFIEPDGKGGVLLEFSGKELISGESDGSSFPSGGLRSTFEARSYTAWDPSSYAFIKDGSLCIPTVFCSHDAESLDKKTPLLRSMQAINKQAVRLLKILGDDEVTHVNINVGAEQEYFLIDKSVYLKRPDLMNCGRTLFGATPPKGQELSDHYYGAIEPRVKRFMEELDEELWKLGVLAKTKHNEVAPTQHEFAPIYTTVNIATDHNQLTMELMKNIADKHHFACLLHEKPFARVNGSGKHVNWSIATNHGVNLLSPGNTPAKNVQFLLMLCAVIKAVDEHQDLLRITIASASNDQRLGGHEAPPAIISMFLGEELDEVLEAIEKGDKYVGKERKLMELGVSVLPNWSKESTDRNRTSPFAFTGNKFEFRMPGSALSVAGPCTMLNTIVAESLAQFADTLEGSTDITKDAAKLIKETITKHRRIIYSGDNYTKEWEEEAARRGLLILPTLPDAIKLYETEKNFELFEKHGVLNEAEIRSRARVKLRKYAQTIDIEADTLLDIVNKEIIPSVINHQNALARLLRRKQQIDSKLSTLLEKSFLERNANLSETLCKKTDQLTQALAEIKGVRGKTSQEKAEHYRDRVLASMNELRETIDELESLVGTEYWSLPTYAEIFASVK